MDTFCTVDRAVEPTYPIARTQDGPKLVISLVMQKWAYILLTFLALSSAPSFALPPMAPAVVPGNTIVANPTLLAPAQPLASVNPTGQPTIRLLRPPNKKKAASSDAASTPPSLPSLGSPEQNKNNLANSPGATTNNYTPPATYSVDSPRNPSTVSNRSDATSGKLCVPGTAQFSQNGGTRGTSYCDYIEQEITSDCNKPVLDKLKSVHVGGPQLVGMEEMCPGFTSASAEEKVQVLKQFVASMVVTESDWRTNSTGDNGNSKGLLSLTVATDKSKGCSCGELTEANIFQAKVNLQCGTRMLISQMAEDMVVGAGDGPHSKIYGAAKSFGPLRTGHGERKDITARLSSWCRLNIGVSRTPASDPAPSTGT